MLEQKKIFWAVMITSFGGPFMSSSINVAVPAMAQDFGKSPEILTWAVTAFLIGAAAGLLPFGRLADIKGRRKVYTCGLVGISIMTIACALSTNFLVFIFARFFQGVAMAMIFGTSMALLVSCCNPENRGKTIGFSGAFVYTGVSVGPFIGGFITDYLGWRMIFWFTAVMLITNLSLIYRVREDWYGAKNQKFDFLGAVIYVAMVILFLYGLSDWTRHQFVHYMPFAALILFLLFIWREKNSPSPLLNLSLFKNTVFAMSNLAALIHYSATFAIGFVLSLYLQVVRGMDASTAGMFLLIQPCLMAILSPRAGALSDKFSPRIIASLGMFIMMVNLFILSFIHENTDLYFICVILMFIGIGFALFSAPNNNAIMGAVKKEVYGVASSILAVMRLIGQALSMALVTLILSICVADVLSVNYTASLLNSFDYIFKLFGFLCILALIASLMRGKKNEQDK